MNKLTKSELIHFTNRWCRSNGISLRDLTNHPQIEDVVLLVNFRNEFWRDMTASEQGTWSAYWSLVYHKQFTIKQAHLGKLETIARSCEFIRQKQAERKATIQAMRTRQIAKAQNKMEDVYDG